MKAVIIEDEKLASDYLETLLQKNSFNIDVIKIIDNVKDAIQWLSQHTVDIIFLDIHLGDDTSFSIFEKLHINTPIIFTTAYNEYAIKAFKLNSIDYLLKPIDEDELRASIDKLKKRILNSNPFDMQKLLEVMQQKEDYQERFMVVSGQKIKSILIDQVAYFLSEGRYIKLVTNNNEKYLLDQSLENLENKLNPNYFYRVNRQVIVSFTSIQQMIVWSKSRVKLELNPITEFDVIVSIDKSGEFKKWLNR
ncbi:LytTR family DNA-binding domain-containing protein [Mariniflexile litorale]|uniref:LytTR family DNA-binding domain-containing protein n=1 Tax=Mariniflexile litorale TaxID=3045158 RepID=A0AAU7EHA4_9FLAO|nr:LytTR family DNA-binding domain-containing protein [Mariniflexile sp. KMM 9835]MDQ8211994.1 LytTR family DNA-binding domain-containing protein [Mariniflexile sp. KMM 9835]